MAVPSSGPLSFADIALEFDDTTPYSMDEYTRGGALVPEAPANQNIPTNPTGTRSFEDYRGATKEISVTLTLANSPYELVDMKAEFDQFDIDQGNTESTWDSGTPVRLIIEPGVIVGSTTPSTPALTIPSRAQGTVSVTNGGSIQGSGGNGTVGGSAVVANNPTTITNNGQIYAGGGAGGTGGAGGAGNCCGPGPGVCIQTGGQCNTPCGSCTINGNAGNCGTNKNPRTFRICGQLSYPTVCSGTPAGTGLSLIHI